MEKFIPVVLQLFEAIPGMVKAGFQVADLVKGGIAATKQIGTAVSPSNEDFQKLDALATEYDNDFDAAVAARDADI